MQRQGEPAAQVIGANPFMGRTLLKKALGPDEETAVGPYWAVNNIQTTPPPVSIAT